jgi:hypothetical protein
MSTKLFNILSTLALATFVVGASYAHDYYMVQERYRCYVETNKEDGLDAYTLCGINADGWRKGMVEGWLRWYYFYEFNGEDK